MTKKRVPVCIRLPEDLAFKVDMLLLDARGRVKYGAKQRLIERLLREWVERELAKRNIRVEVEKGGEQ